jgi:hypothetical protein
MVHNTFPTPSCSAYTFGAARECKLTSRTEADAPALTVNEFCAAGSISRRTFYTMAERNEAAATLRIGRHQQRRCGTVMTWWRSHGVA